MEQIVDYLENGQERMKFPDREAKFIRNHPFMTQLDFFDMQEEQQRAWEVEKRRHEAKRIAEDTKTSEALVLVKDETSDVGVGEYDPMFIADWDAAAANATDVFEAETHRMDTQDASKKHLMAQTMAYATRISTANPSTSMWDFITPPHDPEPGPDGKFHWEAMGDQWDDSRKRLRGRYPKGAIPITAPENRVPDEFSPFHHIWTKGPDGEFFRIVVTEGAKIGVQGAKNFGSNVMKKLKGPTEEERASMEEEAENERKWLEDQEYYKKMKEEQRERESAMAEIDKEASKAQYEYLHGARLEFERNMADRSSSSSALPDDRHAPSKIFSHPVSDKVRISGGKIVGDWQTPLLKMARGTRQIEARLV